MDIVLIRTFLEVAAAGTFADAADRLLVTQSAVSLRIQRLEQALGQTLFTRSKAGAVLTPQGVAFERYALAIIRTWEEARQQIAVPRDFESSLTVAAELSLWPRLGFRLVDQIRRLAPRVSLRAEVGKADSLTRLMVEGTAQVALVYAPHLRPGLEARKLFDDQLVMVKTWQGNELDLKGRYVFIDWGPEFTHAHAETLPDLTNPGLTFNLGVLSGEFLIRRHFAGYLPARWVRRQLDAGRLFLVPDMPAFAHPAWIVWQESLGSETLETLDTALQAVLAGIDADNDAVVDALTDD